MTTQPIPHAINVTGRPHGIPPCCVSCHQAIDTDADYWLLLDRPPRQRPHILAAAHGPRWDDHLDDYDHTCPDTLHRLWRRQVLQAGAHLLRVGVDGGGPRWFAGDEPLHAGTPLDVLAANGTWLTGRYEYQLDTRGCTPFLYLAIGAWDHPAVPLQLLEDTIVLIPSR